MSQRVSRGPRPRLSAATAFAHAAIAFLTAVGVVILGCSGGPKPAEGPGAASSQGSSKGTRGWRPSLPDTLGPVVAVVGARRITRHDVDSVIATAPPSLQTQLREPEGYREVVNRLVMQQVMYDAAEHSGLERDSVYQSDLKRYARERLVRRFYDFHMETMPEIADSVKRAYYDGHQEEFALNARSQLRHIALPSRAKALEIRRKLQKGALWDETCAKFSSDKTTRENGGQLGWVASDGDLVPGIGKAPALVAAGFSLPIDEISQPLKSEKSWHLIKVSSREEKFTQPYDTVKERIANRLRPNYRDEYGKAFADSLLKYSNATVFEDSIRVAIVPARTPEDFFKEAQAAATPLQRIELYRILIQRFPQEHVTAQAQFMIGFTYAEELREFDFARKELEEFLSRYPDSDLAGSARWMLDNMENPIPNLDGDSGEGSGGAAGPDSAKAGPPGGSE